MTSEHVADLSTVTLFPAGEVFDPARHGIFLVRGADRQARLALTSTVGAQLVDSGCHVTVFGDAVDRDQADRFAHRMLAVARHPAGLNYRTILILNDPAWLRRTVRGVPPVSRTLSDLAAAVGQGRIGIVANVPTTSPLLFGRLGRELRQGAGLVATCRPDGGIEWWSRESASG